METVCRVVETCLGDTSASASELQAVAEQLGSASSCTPSLQVHRSEKELKVITVRNEESDRPKILLQERS
jgi:hypothetical protein